MLAIFFKRILLAIPVLFAVATITFFLIKIAPGGPFDADRAVSPQVLKNLNEAYNLNASNWEQYVDYMSGLLRGDLGPSFRFPGRSVSEMIATGLPVTFELAFYAILIALVMGVFSGVLAALKRNTFLDFIPMSIAMIGICVPNFLMGPLLVLIFAPIFILIFAPGFYFDPIKKDIAVTTLRIMFPYLALISLVAFAGGIQNSHGKFSIPAATPMIFNLCLIISAVYVAPKYNMPVYVLAWGVLLAGFIQLLVQYFPLHTVDRIPRPKLNLDNTGLKKFLKLILPAILAGGIIQINLLIDTIFASFLITGSPTWLYLSERLIQFPLGLFGVAVALVALPNITELFLEKKMEELTYQCRKLLKVLFFLGLFCVLGAFLFGELAIKLLFLRGEFTSFDVGMTFLALQGYAFSLLFILPQKFFNSIFFAISKANMVVVTGLVSLISNIIFSDFK